MNFPMKTGVASYYADKFEGRKTATGERFSQKCMTAASNHYKLGTIVRVSTNEESVVVRINDRMGHKGRLIDLSKRAAKELRIIGKGISRVTVTPL